jgi:hypothetical protein
MRKYPGSSSSSSVQLESAVGHLFRAAAGLTGAAAAPLRLVLQLLRQRQGSSSALAGQLAGNAAAVPADMEMDGELAGNEDVAKAQQDAQLRLQFCQAVVLLFEREGVTQGALAFARAALGAVDAAYGPEQQQEKLQQQGEQRLRVLLVCAWLLGAVNVFIWCCMSTQESQSAFVKAPLLQVRSELFLLCLLLRLRGAIACWYNAIATLPP